jgi:CheY-like chemotaxis protein
MDGYMPSWDNQREQIRKQLSELEAAISETEKMADHQRHSLQEAKHKLEDLLLRSPNARDTLYQLPLVLHALTEQKLIGAALLGHDGKVVMHHARLLGINPLTSTFFDNCFFDADTGELLSFEDLPWQRCLRGQEIHGMTRIKIRTPEMQHDVYSDVSVIPFRNDNQVSGLVALFNDVSETIQADNFMRTLCHRLEHQLQAIEGAQRELNQLADKLGTKAWLPADTVLRDSVPTSTPAGGSAPTRGHHSGAKVLIVDDIPVNHQLLGMQLKKLGISADTANNGAEAIVLCSKYRYALVFMDLDMPIVNGLEATIQIRENEKNLSIHTPIVAMTSYDREGDKEKCLLSGMDDYLSKSVNKARLQAIVRQYLFNGKEGTPAASTAPASPSIPVADSEGAKLDLKMLEEELGSEWKQVVSLFVASASTLLNCLQFAIEEHDAESVSHFAYSLKGPCATVGLSGLAQLAANVNMWAERGQWDYANHSYKSLRRMFSGVKQQVGSIPNIQLSASPTT